MEHLVEGTPEASTKHAKDRLNLIRGIQLLLFGIMIGAFAVTAVYEMYFVNPHQLLRTLAIITRSSQRGGSGSQNLSKGRSIRALDSSETNDSPMLTLCRSKLATANKKLQEEKDASEAIKANLSTCDANNKALKEGMSSEKELEPSTEPSTRWKTLETLNRTLQICRDEMDALEEEKTSSEERFTECLATASKCDFGWSYLKETDSCYYHRDLTKDAQGELMKYRWKTAEDNCVFWGGHLVSIHSKKEFEFVNDLIQSDVKSLNEDATEINACDGSDFYAWNGLHFVNGRRKWSDGTPDDYFQQDQLKNIHYYLMCNDVSNVRPISSLYYTTDPGEVQARFVCKKDSNE